MVVLISSLFLLMVLSCQASPTEKALVVAYDFACHSNMRNGCPEIFDPLCASDSKTYASTCALCVKNFALTDQGKAGLTIKHDGECKKDGDAPLNDQATSNANLVFPHTVDCRTEYPMLPGCNLMYDPVCGSDGKDYGNECSLCAAALETGREIQVTRMGRCDGTQPFTVIPNFKV